MGTATSSPRRLNAPPPLLPPEIVASVLIHVLPSSLVYPAMIPTDNVMLSPPIAGNPTIVRDSPIFVTLLIRTGLKGLVLEFNGDNCNRAKSASAFFAVIVAEKSSEGTSSELLLRHISILVTSHSVVDSMT